MKKKIPFQWLGGTSISAQTERISHARHEKSCKTGSTPCIPSNFPVNYKVTDKINSSFKSSWMQFKFQNQLKWRPVVRVWGWQGARGSMSAFPTVVYFIKISANQNNGKLSGDDLFLIKCISLPELLAMRFMALWREPDLAAPFLPKSL